MSQSWRLDTHIIFRLIKGGDWLILALAALSTALLASELWQDNAADKAIIRSGGQIFAVTPLLHDRIYDVPGPLGITRIAISSLGARILSDPSPRQICVRQGWIKHSGEIALCLPNQVSVELQGQTRHYDSLNY